MPTISDKGFIIYIKKYNDRSSIIKIFSENNGVVSSFLKKTNIKSDKYKDQVGNFVNFVYNFKNIESYGTIETNNINDFLNIIFDKKLNLLLFNSLITIINNILIENENVNLLYKIFYNLMFSLKDNNKNILLNYVDFLFNIVEYTGIAINYNVNEINDLFYISPKTGNCVSKQYGEKYKDKLFIIPKCFFELTTDIEDIVNAINILHFFIYKYCKENNIIKKYNSIKFFKNELIKYLIDKNDK